MASIERYFMRNPPLARQRVANILEPGGRRG
jgi:uncharacterized protein YneF (UPF0154 family)